jgi:D-alanine-D-alanine ligase
MTKKRIGIIFGGRSGEHEISIRSATTVIEQINKDKYEIIPIAINCEGNWLNPVEAINLLPTNTQKLLQGYNFSEDLIAFIGDTNYKGLTKLGNSESADRILPLDIVFPVLHGTFGEDGTIQGLFEMAGIPYVGCGVLASACGMDKVVMKTLFRDADLPICNYVWFLRREWENNNELVIEKIEDTLGYPCFVKPANLGSSVGVTKATDIETLKEGIELAAQYDRKIIVEEHLDMREIECAVIGNDEPKASLPGEYLIHDDSKAFLDYTEKYSGTGNNEFIVPALISEELTEKIQNLAIQAFKAIDGAGFARVDFFLRKDTGALLVNEINTIPGLTSASGFPKMWAGTGMNFTRVIDSLVDYAFERFEDKIRNRTNL